ncbi:MAG: hypothetical protein ACKVVP_00785 [Chloroflexota bacterium]
MIRLIRWQVAAVTAVLLSVAVVAPNTLLAGPVDQKGTSSPDIAPFQSAQFDLKGFVRLDGITVDVSGQGSLAPPDRSAGTYKFGPFTLETVTIGSTVYARSRFEPRWEAQEIPSELPVNVGPIVASDIFPKGPYTLQGQERVDGKLTTRWSTDLDLGLLLALSEFSPTSDDNVRDALKSLKANLEVWVGNDDRLLYKERVVFTFTVPAIEPQGDPLPGTIDLAMTYSKHNQPVTIQSPVSDEPRRRNVTFPKLQSLYRGIHETGLGSTTGG